MREEEYRAAGRLFESGYPDGGQTDRRLGGLLGLLANFDHLVAICLGVEEQILGRDSVPEPDIAFLLRCVVAAKQEVFRLYSVEHYHGENGGELSLLNRIEEELLQYQADMHYLGIYPDNPPSNT